MTAGGGIEIGGNINTLGGVDITTPVDGQILIYVAATQTWVNANNTPGAATLAGLTDVNLTSPTANDFLVYNGTKWINLGNASAQAAIGLAVGVNVEAWSSSLDSLAALTGTGFVVQTGSNMFANRDINGTAGTISITNGDGVAGNPVITIDPTYIGQSSITTLGTVTSGLITIGAGGTGATTAAGARTNLGLIIGTDVEAWSASLDALASLSGTGFISQTGINTFAERTITGTLNRLSVTDGDGVSADPVLDIDSNYVGQSSITTLGAVTTGTWNANPIGIIYGGTGQTTKTASFDALSPLTTKGDIIVYNGTNNIRVGVGSNGQVLQSDSTAPYGVSWVTSPVGAYNTVENAGIPVTQRQILNLVGGGITATDNNVLSTTDITLANPLIDIAGLSPTLDNIIYGNGTHFVASALTQQQTIFVALNGSDTTGNGSINFPYRTIAHANSVITDAANLKKYAVVLMGGRFDETSNILLKPYVDYVGIGGSSFTYITSPNNQIAPDSSYNNANGRSSLVNLYVGGSTGINWDLSGLGTSGSAVLDLVNVQMNGGLTYKGRNLGADFLQTEGGCYWLGNTQLSNCQITIIGGFCGGTTTIDTAASTGHMLGNIQNFGFGGNVSVTSTAGIQNAISITNCSISTNSLTVSGATTSFSIDSISLPATQSNYTISGGATVTYLTYAYSIQSGYTPVHYTATSADIKGNLQGIDNALGTISPGAFPWTSVAGTSQTLAANNGYFAANSSLTTFTLPATASVGDTYRISAAGAGLFTVAQNAGQSIRFAMDVTTVGTGGNITATSQGDSITIVCKVANTGFQAVDSVGNFNVV